MSTKEITRMIKIREKRLRASYRRKMVILAIVMLIIGLLAGYILHGVFSTPKKTEVVEPTQIPAIEQEIEGEEEYNADLALLAGEDMLEDEEVFEEEEAFEEEKEGFFPEDYEYPFEDEEAEAAFADFSEESDETEQDEEWDDWTTDGDPGDIVGDFIESEEEAPVVIMPPAKVEAAAPVVEETAPVAEEPVEAAAVEEEPVEEAPAVEEPVEVVPAVQAPITAGELEQTAAVEEVNEAQTEEAVEAEPAEEKAEEAPALEAVPAVSVVTEPTEAPVVLPETEEAAEEPAAVETPVEEAEPAAAEETVEEETVETPAEPVPFGESITLTTDVHADGSRRDTNDDQPYDNVSITMRVKNYLGVDYYQQTYADKYDLKTGTAAAVVEMTLNDYKGATPVIPQNCMLITFRGENPDFTSQGVQIINKEIAGDTGVMLVNGVKRTMYKRYYYDPAAGEMRYMCVTAYVNGKPVTYEFDLKRPELTAEEKEKEKSGLTVGSKGDDVQKLQETLIAEGLLGGTADGQFGSKTEEAVKVMQRKLGMEETGIAGPKFLEALYGAAPAKVYEPLAFGAKGDAVTELQEALIKKGALAEGNAVGNYGSKTVEAVKKLQTEYGMEANGTADHAFQERLFGE